MGSKSGAGRKRRRIGGQALATLERSKRPPTDPAASQLVVAGNVKAEGLDQADRRGANHIGDRRPIDELRDARPRPDEFAACHEGVIDGAAQRLPSQHGIHTEQLIVAVGERTVAARIGKAEIDVGVFLRDRRKRADDPPRTDRFALSARKTRSSLSPRKTCAVPSRKRPFGEGRMRLSDRPASSMPSSPPTRSCVDQRPVDPGKHVVVQAY